MSPVLVDGREVPSDTIFETKVCIVGFGPAGQILSEELSAAGVQHIILESGLPGLDVDIWRLNEGEVTGLPYPIRESRARGFGGSALAWDMDVGGVSGARYRPLDEEDFGDTGGLRGISWPFGRSELHRFYEMAHRRCSLGEAEQTNLDAGSKLLASGELSPSEFYFGPQSAFTRDEPLEGGLRRVIYGATATRLVRSTADSPIESVSVGTLTGKVFTIEAEIFVLACGGLENAKLLLTSHPPGERTPIGNSNDLVGRFFMEHLHLWSGVVESPQPIVKAPSTDFTRSGSAWIKNKFAVTPEAQEAIGILSGAAMLTERPWAEPPGYLAHQGRISAVVDRIPEDADRKERFEIARSDWRSATGWATRKATWELYGRRASQSRHARGGQLLEIYVFAEQFPNRDSRVYLADEVDELGMRLLDPDCRKLVLDWRITDIDVATVRSTHRLLSDRLEILGPSRIGSRFREEGLPPGLRGGFHHMGTTTMHTSPRKGVVDADLRVHDASNLFVAGSSVFPTVGYANPTLTVCALAYRLAERLIAMMGPAQAD
ncbi:GMC family oxidoreductase [soil metagenome]